MTLQLVPRQHSTHPAIHVASSHKSQAMQLALSTETQPFTKLSPPAEYLPDNTFMVSPHPFHFLPIDFCTQVGVNPFMSLGRPIPSTSSLATTSQLGSSRFSEVDKGKSPLVFVSFDSPPLIEPTQTFSLTNISHPYPITISPPLIHPTHFTDFLAKWPQPFSPRPIIQPSPNFVPSDSHLDQTPLHPSLGLSSLPSTKAHLPFISTPAQPLHSFIVSTTQKLDHGRSLSSAKPLPPYPTTWSDPFFKSNLHILMLS